MQQGAVEGLKLIESDMNSVRIGRRKYCEREGQELKAFEWVEEDEIDNRVETLPGKRKGRWGSADYNPTPSLDGAGGRRGSNRKYDEIDDRDHDEYDIFVKSDVKPASAGLTIKEQFAFQSTLCDDDVEKSLSPTFDNMDLAAPSPRETIVPLKHREAAHHKTSKSLACEHRPPEDQHEPQDPRADG